MGYNYDFNDDFSKITSLYKALKHQPKTQEMEQSEQQE